MTCKEAVESFHELDVVGTSGIAVRVTVDAGVEVDLTNVGLDLVGPLFLVGLGAQGVPFHPQEAYRHSNWFQVDLGHRPDACQVVWSKLLEAVFQPVLSKVLGVLDTDFLGAPNVTRGLDLDCLESRALLAGRASEEAQEIELISPTWAKE